MILTDVCRRGIGTPRSTASGSSLGMTNPRTIRVSVLSIRKRILGVASRLGAFRRKLCWNVLRISIRDSRGVIISEEMFVMMGVMYYGSRDICVLYREAFLAIMR